MMKINLFLNKNHQNIKFKKNLFWTNPQLLLLHIARHIFMRQPQICHTAHVPSYTHILTTTYTTSYNNTQT